MATDPRPLIVLAGPIHPDGKALLEKEARVVVCEDETEAGLVKTAAEAQGILFRIRPRCTASLMGACQKPSAIFINTSRAPVQDERALFEALTRGKLAAAGLDVWEDEPTSRDNPMLNLQNVVCSSHVAGVTREATRQAAMQVSGEMLRVLRGERPDVLVNPDVWPRLGRR